MKTLHYGRESTFKFGHFWLGYFKMSILGGKGKRFLYSIVHPSMTNSLFYYLFYSFFVYSFLCYWISKLILFVLRLSDCWKTMDEKKQIRLTPAVKAALSQVINIAKCIICQNSTPEPTKTSENGRKRVCEAAIIWDDIVSKRLKLIDKENFVYHMSNSYYKAYAIRSHPLTLQRIFIQSREVDHA